MTDRVYVVTMVADEDAAADSGSRAVTNAIVDPIFSFDVGVDRSLYSFRFSDGIGNAVAVVPEPATASLLAARLLAFAAAERGRTTTRALKRA